MSGDFKSMLGDAAALGREYRWLEAADKYEHVLQLVGEGDFFRRGDIQEKIGYCLQRVAFQAESREEFLERLRKAVEAHEAARGLYKRVADERGAGWASRSGAVARYLEHWIEPDPAEKLSLLEEGLELKRRTLTAFQGMENMLEYSRTYNMITELVWHRINREYEQWNLVTEYDIDEIEQSRARIRQIVEDGIRWGEMSVATLSKLGDPYEIAKAHYALAHCLCARVPLASGIEEYEQYWSQAREQLHRAINLSESVEDEHTLGHSYDLLGRVTAGEEGQSYLERALEFGEKTRDIFLMVRVLSEYIDKIWWLYVIPNEDPDQRLVQAEKTMAFYDRHMHYCSIMSFYGYGGGVIKPPGGYCEYYWNRAGWETDLQKRLEFLEKSVEAGMNALKLAKAVGNKIGVMRHYLSKALLERARLDPDIDKKRSMLEKALLYRERNVTLTEIWGSPHIWNVGIGYSYLSDIKTQLAYIEPDLDDKRRLLEEAVLDKGKALPLMAKWLLADERRVHMYARLSRSQDGYATQLTNLYEVTDESEYLRRAIEASQKAIESASKVDFVSRIAESYWKIAKAQAILGEHVEAAENFDCASESYEKAAEKIPQLKNFYREYASYMRAWAEFERAKHSHMEKRYMQAKEHYEKAAELHKSTERWSYLYPNYQAWARLEEAEDLSRREQTEEARDLFRQAIDLFKEAKGTIEIELVKIQDEDEKKLLVNLAQASDIRREYCLGRNALEDGRILDRQGDHLASSRRYGSAAKTFQRIAGSSEEARRELRPLVCLCQAWQKMTQAEARTLPALYSEASKLFEEAREHSQDERSRRLALGHSRFCRALETGTRFEDTRDSTLYSEAIQHLGSAASHYLRAGFESAAEYARATQRLFDGYIYMDNAQKEVDPLKRARYYAMAERVLETSAGSYLMAKHPEKSEEVKRLLRRVREERELAATLSEVLHAPITVSTTEAFTAPMPTREEAVGLERFENADIQANIILRKGDVKIGDNIDIEIELVNAGKAPAQLIKVEEIIPEGFEVSSAPDICRVEDSYLDMKGRTLNPLKTAELRLVLKPIRKGTFDLRPRVLYLDEAGKYRSHEPEPATVVVSELGIRGWLRGPTR